MAGIGGVAYELGCTRMSVAELQAAGLLRSEAAVLEGFGFRHVHVAEGESPWELGCRAAAAVLERCGVRPEDVGLLVWAGPQGPTAFSPAPDAAGSVASLRTTARFRLPGPRLQHRLGLDGAVVMGVDQGACTNLFAAIRTARAYCLADGVEVALCVSAEFFPADAGREAIYNCTSDAAVAVVVQRGVRHRIVGSAHVSKGYYWDCDARRDELVAAYFPTACHVIGAAAASAGWSLEEVDWIIPHNVSRRSWEVLLALLGVPAERLWDRNIGRIGHTLSGDNFINLADALECGDVTPGQRLVLFSHGYGAHWTALAVQA